MTYNTTLLISRIPFCWAQDIIILRLHNNTIANNVPQLLPSLLRVIPSEQPQVKDPPVLVQVPWQLWVLVVHSLISKNKMSLSLVYQLSSTKVILLDVPLQFKPLLAKVYPEVQEHWKEASVLVQVCSHPPLLVKHSFTAANITPC